MLRECVPAHEAQPFFLCADRAAAGVGQFYPYDSCLLSAVAPKHTTPSHTLFLCQCPLAAGHSLARSSLGSGICASALSTNRKISSMPESAITADFRQSLDVEGDFSTKIALDSEFALDHFSDAVNLCFGEISHPGIRINVCGRNQSIADRWTDSVNVRKRNNDSLVSGNVYSGDTCHFLILVSACVEGRCKSP
jgi:hypothetical protein